MASDKIYPSAVIYKLFDKSNDKLVYIGSTNDFNRRISAHKSAYKMYMNGKCRYITSFAIIKNNNYDYEILETFTNISKADLFKKETEYMISIDCVNKQKAYLSDEERKANHCEQNKIYRNKNKDNIHKTKNEKFNCDVCNGKYTRVHKSRHEHSKKHIKTLQAKLQALEKRVEEVEKKIDDSQAKIVYNISNSGSGDVNINNNQQ
jgi:hypothetical protein